MKPRAAEHSEGSPLHRAVTGNGDLTRNALLSLFFFPKTYWIRKKDLKQMQENIYNHERWNEYMNACNKLSVIFLYLKESQCIF